ncbi:hypothetical protein NDU88_007603 [Pleurodeles waltl]|uniref:Uncharacterized protein n=1 Tax=Pleurodeles waltl TaxID=8319 RepID=A0AAV7PPG1_PLEWA|nr:hypothetical protein NDU88_007603 [Pleurodeles waltl]
MVGPHPAPGDRWAPYWLECRGGPCVCCPWRAPRLTGLDAGAWFSQGGLLSPFPPPGLRESRARSWGSRGVPARSAERFWHRVGRWLELWDMVGPVQSGRSAVGTARTSGVDDMDWRRRGEGQKQVSEQQGDNSVSKVEIQQDGAMAVVDPE